MADKNALGGKDLTKFWLYMGVIALCVAAMLYMLLSAKPQVSPAVKDSPGGGMSVVLPLPCASRLQSVG